MTYITRRRSGRKYYYYKDDEKITDNEIVERINKLAIPPAWSNVEIAVSKTAKIQARGKDGAGRAQAIYHPTFRLKQEKLKFERILRFAQALPGLRKQLKKDLARKKLGKEKVLACIITLIDDKFFRVGNQQYAKEHQSYGITTLRSKHANITSTTVTFDFIGKSGKQHVKKIKDKQLVRILKQLDEMPGHQIFRYIDDDGHMHDITSQDVNEYIHTYAGDDFTAKDFRTWGGTLLALTALLADEIDAKDASRARKKAVTTTIKQVAKRLGNTPAIARSSYIDPRIIAAYEDGVSLPKLKTAMVQMKPKEYLTIEEQCVLKLLS